MQSAGQPICERMLEVRPLKTGQPLPRDLSIEQVKSLLNAIQSEMDRAWFLLMLHVRLAFQFRFLVRLKPPDSSTPVL
jgi:hypothetical protein